MWTASYQLRPNVKGHSEDDYMKDELSWIGMIEWVQSDKTDPQIHFQI